MRCEGRFRARSRSLLYVLPIALLVVLPLSGAARNLSSPMRHAVMRMR